MNRIEIRNLSGQVLDLSPLEEAARLVLAAEGASLDALSVALVDDEQMTELNERFLGRRRPTDVIAFEAEEGEGEVIISVDTAARQAEEEGHSLPIEMRYLLAHGVLHVLGYDDADEQSRQRMFDRQHEILGTR